jgi:hypothetical protein
MKKTILLLTLVFIVASCSTTRKVTEDRTNQNYTSVNTERDGSSFEKAILIKEKNEMAGIDAEYAWIKQNYPDSKLKGQSLVNHDNKPYDIIKIKTSDGKELSIYFDISNFFGKF